MPRNCVDNVNTPLRFILTYYKGVMWPEHECDNFNLVLDLKKAWTVLPWRTPKCQGC